MLGNSSRKSPQTDARQESNEHHREVDPSNADDKPGKDDGKPDRQVSFPPAIDFVTGVL
jgi:hypothetical protein